MKNKTFYVYFKQSGEGCDYTIGCGQTLVKLEAKSYLAAEKEVKKLLMDNEYDIEVLEKGLILEGVFGEIDLGEIQTEIEEANTHPHSEDNDYQEWLRLSEKFKNITE